MNNMLVAMLLASLLTSLSCSGGEKGAASLIDTNPTNTQPPPVPNGEGSLSNPTQLTSGSPHYGFIDSNGLSYYKYLVANSSYGIIELANATPSMTGLTWTAYLYASFTTMMGTCNSTKTMTPGTITCETDASVAPGTVYYVKVQNNSGSPVTYTVTAAEWTAKKPTAPWSVSAIAASAQSTITWAPVSSATSYNIYWSLLSPVVIGGAGVIKSKGAVSPYAHTGLTSGTTYYYVVTAINPNGESLMSNEVSAVAL